MLITLVLVVSLPARAQEQKTALVASAEESFSALHQALTAQATNLLADAQRREPAPRTNSEASPRALNNAPISTLADQANASLESRGTLKRLELLQPLVQPILREEGIPPQMAAVVLVESGGRINALSPKGARGLWQFMPETARRYGLTVTGTVDERLDPYKSTRAAARYLRDLYAQFGNWQLVLAAYNAGEDKVEHAIERTGTRDFLSMDQPGLLPVETRHYVPAVLNAMGIMKTVNTSDNYFAGVGNNSAVKWVIYAVPEAEN
jgi:soluble lytic murein transglycosylase-like protein